MRMKIRQITYVGIFAAITAVCSQIAFPLPFTSVPVTLSLLAVFLCGAVLSPWEAFASQLVYLLIGAIGVPVYAQLTSGPAILFGMTGGYLFAYAMMSPLIAFSAKKFKSHLFPALICGMVLSLIVCYTVGTVWFVLVTQSTFIAALSACVVPFIIPDLAKIALAAVLGVAIRKALHKAKLYEPA